MQPDRRAFLVHSAGSLAALTILPDLDFSRPYAPAEPLTVALIGAGRQGRAILTELARIGNVKVGAICDANPARLAAALGRLPNAEGFADYRALLAKRADVKAVIVATPTHQHLAIVRDALQAGRHVYCEAPIAHTAEDADALVDLAAGTKLVAQAGLLARSNPIYQLARTFFRSDSVRDIVSMAAQHHRKTSWRVPAPDGMADREANWRLDPSVSLGLAGELGTHQFDVFTWYRSREPSAAAGTGAVRLHKDGRTVADTIFATLTWDDGTALHYDATLANSFGGQYEVFHGVMATLKLAWSHGWMFKEADAPTQGWEVYANRQQYFNDEGITLIADATKLVAQGKLKQGVGLPFTSLYYGLADFVRSVSEGAPPVSTMADGMRATRIGIAVNRAIREGGVVKI